MLMKTHDGSELTSRSAWCFCAAEQTFFQHRGQRQILHSVWEADGCTHQCLTMDG